MEIMVNMKGAERSYSIFIAEGMLDQVGPGLKGHFNGKAYVVTDENVGMLYGERLNSSLEYNGMDFIH